MKRTLNITLVAVLLTSLSLHAQQVGANKTPDSANKLVLNVTTELVAEPVSVKDKKGNPIAGLTVKDFTVTEDNVPQTIRYCEYQTLPTAAEAVAVPAPVINASNIKIYRELGRSQIAAETDGSLKYKDKRLMAIYFDMSAMPPDDQLRALDAATKFIKTQMTTADRVAIMRYASGSVDVLQDFTDDRERLLSIIATLTVGEGQGNDEQADDASTSDTGAAFGQDSGEFNIFNTDRQLSALQTAANMLGKLSEKKSLVYFASGLRLNGLDNQAQLHATIDAAIRAGVSFWPIDARGLTASAPLGDATQGSQGNQGMYTGAASLAVRNNFQQSQDTLFALAGDTGGKALFDYNDLDRGIVQAQASVSSYYIIGYYTTNTTQDGKFRHIKVSVNNTEAKLDFRQGYYAGKVFAKFTATDKERQLEDALMLNDPITDLTISMEIDYFQLNRAEYFVPLTVKIPGRELSLAKQRGAEHTLIDFIGEIKDNYGGVTVSNIHDKVNIKLSDATAAELANRPIEYDSGFTLLPGKYTIKFLARDDETGRIGTFQTEFTIPNLNKEDKKIATSAVVLGSQLISPRAALYNAEKAKDADKAEAVDPLVQNGQRIIPSVTRVFHRSRNFYVYLQAYEQGVTPPEPLIAYVSFYNDQKKVLESKAIEVKQSLGNRLQTMPLSFTLAIDQLPPGRYDCLVTLLDPTGNKTSFWQAPIVVVP